MNKKKIIIRISLVIVFVFLLLAAVGGVSQSEYDSLQASYDKLNAEYTEYKASMKIYEDMTEAEAAARTAEAEQKQQQLAEEAAAKKKAEEAAAKKKAEEEAQKKAEEEKKGYDTGITYNQLARTPDDYTGKKVKFRGKVVQVIDEGDTIGIRLAVNSDYDTILLGTYSADIVKSRVLEDDLITIYGVSGGLYTYESTMGGNITIPSVLIDKIDQ